MGMGVAVSMVAAWPACEASDGPPAVAVRATPSFCMALASASGTSARTTVRIKPEVADSVLKGVSYVFWIRREKGIFLFKDAHPDLVSRRGVPTPFRLSEIVLSSLSSVFAARRGRIHGLLLYIP